MGAFAAAIEGWGVAEFLRRSIWAYPLVSLVHVLAVGFLVTSAVLMDLRVLGIAGRRLEATTVIAHLRPVAIAGLSVAVIAGFLLFSVQASHYAANPVYLTKMALLAVAILNAALFTSFRAERDPEAGATRAMALLSILLWLSVALAGRLIAFFD
jgi:hypothetical protein